MNATVNTVHQGKHGFHPCDRETYLKLKVIHKVYWESVFRLAAWRRWDRKEPQNRVQRWAGKDADNKRIRVIPPVPIPEPKLTPFIMKMEHKKTVQTYVGDYKQWKGPATDYVWHTVKIDPSIYAAVQDFQNARMPVIETQVRPLSLSPEKIDALYQKSLEWLRG